MSPWSPIVKEGLFLPSNSSSLISLVGEGMAWLPRCCPRHGIAAPGSTGWLDTGRGLGFEVADLLVIGLSIKDFGLKRN